MKTIRNYVLVKVSAETENVIETSITDKNGRKVELVRPTFTGDADSLKFNRIYGHVVSVPEKLDGMEPYFRNYPGFPPPSNYRDHESCYRLAMTMTHGERPLREGEKAQVHNFYRPDLHVDTYCRPEDVEVAVGDKVYFHFLSITNDNYMGRDGDGNKLFRVPYDKIICRVVDGDIIPVNGFVLINKYFGEGWEEIEVENRKIRGRFGKNGIISAIKEMPEPLQGVVAHYAHLPNIGEAGRLLMKNLRVLFMPNSEWENTIEDHVYWTMREWDIVATHVDALKGFAPAGDYVMIEPHQTPHTSLIIPEEYKIPAEMGRVIMCGNSVSLAVLDDILNKNVHFNRKSIFNIRHDKHIYVRYPDITMVTDHHVRIKGKQLAKYRKYEGNFNEHI